MHNKKISIRVAGILVRNNKILLIQHKKKKQKYWLVPGGNLEYAENIHTCLKREFKEELSLEILVQDFLFLVETISPDKKRHILNLFYKVNGDCHDIKIGNEERLNAVDFFSYDELDNLVIYPDIKTELKKVLKGKQIKSLSLVKKWI